MEILNYCILSDNGHTLTVPTNKEFKISKEEYKEFKQAVLNIKGEWIGNQQFEFPFNATNVIELIKGGQTVDFRKLQLFPTPYDLAGYMWDCLVYDMKFTFKPNMKVLEPGAGTGNLIKFLRNKGFENIDYCEVCPEFDYIICAETQGIKINKVGTDFLKFDAKSEYDLVFANPPFNKDTKHFAKMLECVKEGGYVCTLMREDFYKDNNKDDFEGFAKKYNVNMWFCTSTPRCEGKDPDEWIFADTPSGYSLLIVRKGGAIELEKVVTVPKSEYKEVVPKMELQKTGQISMF